MSLYEGFICMGLYEYSVHYVHLMDFGEENI